MQITKIGYKIGLWVAVILLVVFSIFPVVQLLSYSLKPQSEWGSPNLIPKQVTLMHYKSLLGLVDSGSQVRKDNFNKELAKVTSEYQLNADISNNITTTVNTWIDESADLDAYIGSFTSYRNTFTNLQNDVANILLENGMAKAKANSFVKLSINAPIESRVLSVLSRLDEKPEKQKQALAKYQDSGFNFKTYFTNSFLFSASSSLVAVILAIFGSYALARLSFFGRDMVSKSVLLTYMVGGILLLVPLFQMASQLGLLETPLRRALFVLAIYVMQTLPVSLYMLGNYFRTISFSLEEAAAMDGYNRIETIFKVVLPLSLPMVATVFVYCFIIAWNEYLFMSSFLKETKSFWTLPIALKFLNSSANDIKGMVSAASILTLVPVVFLFGFVMKHVTGGLSEGGVKE